jgi:hypothetical protein
MKKWITGAVFLAACASSPLMTIEDFSAIQIGQSATSIQNKYGKPVKITTASNGVTTYEYIERMMMGSQISEMKRYFIQIKDGKVVGKYYSRQDQPPYQDIYNDDPFPQQVQ